MTRLTGCPSVPGPVIFTGGVSEWVSNTGCRPREGLQAGGAGVLRPGRSERGRQRRRHREDDM
jgi:hypothetical protein